MNSLSIKLVRKTAITIACIYPALSFAIMCPTNFNQIDLGMSTEQVVAACGKPDKETSSVKENDNVPQEWSYFIQQEVSKSGNMQGMQGTLKTTIVFDDKGKAINISVNGIGVGASTICGGQVINLGDSRDTIKSVCGTPTFINKQEPVVGSPAAVENKIIEYTYLSVNPPVVLVFENGKLSDKR